MQSSSREALARLRERLEAVTAHFSTTDGLSGLSQELYAVAGVLIDQPRLRRTLADASTKPEGRAGLAAGIFDGKISASAIQVLRDAVSLRWSSAWDLVDALGICADEVLFVAAQVDGSLDTVEDELFRFERILDAESELAVILDDQGADPTRRLALLATVLAGRASAVTRELLEHAVASGRKPTLSFAIDDLLAAAAARRERSVAKVFSAVTLSDAQQDRLAAALTQLYGRAISVRTAIDPSLRGGLVVRIGDELIDGSIAARLIGARAALAG